MDSSGLQIQFIYIVLHTIFGNWTGLEFCLSLQKSQSYWNPVDWNPQDCREIHRTQGESMKLKGTQEESIGLDRTQGESTGLKGTQEESTRLPNNS